MIFNYHGNNSKVQASRMIVQDLFPKDKASDKIFVEFDWSSQICVQDSSNIDNKMK
ncbi:uncharacterized protein ASCRUDRAFT_82068 [Ascoidea rubescens DSM 1968]|uniref:Uncharacterized protein n=1 Tax=Ascoidea rubescens DSM 1968 TaxID=1344418 RepID=A0A1D2VCS0_9ASCO|nr:hypothetical protein ASCRUDRAFT_82068 [Ascoidea rubescens DSM 1968]ODV59399.1 hypothetical protein ASCRUDRAFT_82068 [Ascoidea rubescens DSM 1968]